MEEEHSLTSFKPLSPDSSKSGFSFTRFFQRKKPESSPEDGTSGSERSSPLTARRTSPRPSTTNSPQLAGAKGPEPSRGWSSPLQNRRMTPYGGGSPSGYRNLTTVLGRLTAVNVAHRKGQVGLLDALNLFVYLFITRRQKMGSLFFCFFWGGGGWPILQFETAQYGPYTSLFCATNNGRQSA